MALLTKEQMDEIQRERVKLSQAFLDLMRRDIDRLNWIAVKTPTHFTGLSHLITRRLKEIPAAVNQIRR